MKQAPQLGAEWPAVVANHNLNRDQTRAKEKHYNSIPMRSGRGTTVNYHTSNVTNLLEDCNNGSKVLLDPRGNLELWRALWNAIPIFPNSSRRLLDAMGTVSIKSDDKGLENELNEFFETMTVQNNDNPAFKQGVNSYIEMAVKGKHRNGMKWAEMIGTRGNGITGIRLLDPALFDYQDRGNEVILTMATKDRGLVDIKPNRRWQEWSHEFLDEHQFYWAAPIAYLSVWTADKYIRSGKARKNEETRRSVAPELINFSDRLGRENAEEIFLEQATKSALEDIQAKFKSEYVVGINHAMKTGEPFSMVQAKPGAVEMTSHILGQGLSPTSDFTGGISFWMYILSMVTGVPVQMSGFPTPGGMNSDQYKMLLDILKASAQRLKMDVNPNLKQLINQRLISVSAPPSAFERGAYELVWTPATDNRLLEKAEADKMSAEAVAQQLANLEMLRMSPEAADIYAGEIGRPEIRSVIGNNE